MNVDVLGMFSSDAIEVARQMICRARVCVPIGVDGVGATASIHCVGSMLMVLLWLKSVVEAFAAAERIMAVLVAHLASRLGATALAGSTAAPLATSATTMPAAVTAVVLRSAMSATMGAITVARKNIGRGVELPSDDVLLKTELSTEEVSIEGVEVDRIVARGDRGDKRIIFRTETSEHVDKDLFITDKGWLMEAMVSAKPFILFKYSERPYPSSSIAGTESA